MGPTFFFLTTHVVQKMLEGPHYNYVKSSVRTGFNKVQTSCTSPEPRTELMVRFCATPELWTELWSSSEKFEFELRFRTGLWHPYRSAHLIGVAGSQLLPKHFTYHDTLDAFQLFYVNKYVDHHAHEIAF